MARSRLYGLLGVNFCFWPILLQKSFCDTEDKFSGPYRPNLVIETLPSMAFAENHWIGRQLRIGDSVRIEVIAPTPRCAVPMLVHGSLPYCREAVAGVNKLNQVEFPMLGPGTFPCLGAYATVLATGPVRCGDQVVLD